MPPLSFRLWLACAAIILASLPSPAAPASAPASSAVAEFERQVNSLGAGLPKFTAKVEAAIATAEKAGTLKPSTARYYRDLLTRFQGQGTDALDANVIYFPPVFDSSPEMEPINVAWFDLKAEVTRANDLIGTLRERIIISLSAFLREESRTAQDPADLADADKLLGLYRKLEQIPTRMRYPQAGEGSANAWELKIEILREAVTAMKAGDAEKMAATLLRTSENMASRNGLLISPSDVIWIQVRTRLVEHLQTVLNQERRSLEEKLIKRQVDEAFYDQLKKVQTASGWLDQAVNRMRMYTGGSSSTMQVQVNSLERAIAVYRSTAHVVEALRNGFRTARLEPNNYTFPDESASFVLDKEFRIFLSELAQEIAAYRKRNTADDQQRDRSTQKNIEEERLRKARLEAEDQEKAYQQELLALQTRLRDSVAALKTPEAVRALILEIQSLKVPSRRQGNDDSNRVRESLLNLAGELQGVAKAWENGNPAALNVERGDRTPFIRRDTSFGVDLDSLRDLALRSVLAEKLRAPELLQPPLSTLRPAAALRELIRQATTKLDWRRVHTLLTAMDLPQQAGNNVQLPAVRAYLTGLNFEQAEQFSEAIDSYKAVLEFIGDDIPLKESAERLKALRQSHPEAFTRRAASSTPPVAQ